MANKDNFLVKHKVSSPVFWLHIGSLLLIFLSIMFWMISFFKFARLGATGSVTGIALAFGGNMRVYLTTQTTDKLDYPITMVLGLNIAFWLFVAGFGIILLGTFLRATKKPNLYRAVILCGAVTILAGAVLLFFARPLFEDSTQALAVQPYMKDLKGIGNIIVAILGLAGSSTAVLGSFYA